MTLTWLLVFDIFHSKASIYTYIKQQINYFYKYIMFCFISINTFVVLKLTTLNHVLAKMLPFPNFAPREMRFSVISLKVLLFSIWFCVWMNKHDSEKNSHSNLWLPDFNLILNLLWKCQIILFNLAQA